MTPLELTCVELDPGRVTLQPAPRQRRWMDDMTSSQPKRCLPLVIANMHGWEMLCPFGFTARWTGGPALRDVDIQIDDAAAAAARPDFVASHFGTGILTFNPLVIIRTSPGYNLWVTGPTNAFKDGIQAMTASIETDWMPYTFSMNWKLTRTDHWVRFDAGDPFCFFFPIQRGTVGRCDPRLAPIDDEPELAAGYRWARARRDLDSTLAERPADAYQGWYAKGELPRRDAGEAPADHETQIQAKPFRRE